MDASLVLWMNNIYENLLISVVRSRAYEAVAVHPVVNK